MTVYISGQITGLEIDQAKANFKERQRIVEADGHIAINPFDVIEYDPKLTWSDYMIADIKALFECDAITMLDGWELSRGARIEFAIACELGLPSINF